MNMLRIHRKLPEEGGPHVAHSSDCEHLGEAQVWRTQLPALESLEDRGLGLRLVQKFLGLRAVLLLQGVLRPR
jgi:hypothetical protein